MKVNIELDITPEEMRRFLGLPDVQGWQQQMLDSFTENVVSSQEQQQEFLRNVFTQSFAPWQDFFTALAPTPRSTSAKE